MENKIKYETIKDLGFTEVEEYDQVYFLEYGFPYTIIQLFLTDLIYLEWAKETQLCELIRVDSIEEQNILSRMPIKDLEHLIGLINFFVDKKEEAINPPLYA